MLSKKRPRLSEEALSLNAISTVEDFSLRNLAKVKEFIDVSTCLESFLRSLQAAKRRGVKLHFESVLDEMSWLEAFWGVEDDVGYAQKALLCARSVFEKGDPAKMSPIASHLRDGWGRQV